MIVAVSHTWISAESRRDSCGTITTTLIHWLEEVWWYQMKCRQYVRKMSNIWFNFIIIIYYSQPSPSYEGLLTFTHNTITSCWSTVFKPDALPVATLPFTRAWGPAQSGWVLDLILELPSPSLCLKRLPTRQRGYLTIVGTLTGTTTLGQSGPGSNGS